MRIAFTTTVMGSVFHAIISSLRMELALFLMQIIRINLSRIEGLLRTHLSSIHVKLNVILMINLYLLVSFILMAPLKSGH
jgi:hypothetical protein